MPSHYKSKTNDKKKSETKKPNKARALKKEEIDLFKTHSKHHSKEHIEEMKKFIRAGKGCYSMAHKHANKKVGK
tara:strand:- start:1990 stop:2211 length:222 start_codon:yes stop_codon:yes gene_type:complete